MKALTKGQYEGIASVLARGLDARQGIPTDNVAYRAITMVIQTLAQGYAELFEDSDPEFKRELFLSQCGITKEDIK